MRPVCLDLTRLITRVGRGPWTGIDRVEFAYLRELSDRGLLGYALARTAWGHVLLDARGIAELRIRLEGREAWGAPDLLGRLSLKLGPARQSAEADLRRIALARIRRGGLATRLPALLPEDTLYLNVGQTSLDPEVRQAIAGINRARFVALIHDTIPLRSPDSQRPGAVARFRGLLRVASTADGVVCSSDSERAYVVSALEEAGRCPPVVTAHLGVDAVPPDPSDLPAANLPDRTYFVCVGTIEPRKNHALLLDVWDALIADAKGAPVPELHIVGQRGWLNTDVFARLDAWKPRGGAVVEHGGLSDAARSALVSRASALLFPSFHEGYGLPPLEALALGTPVICSDLPVCRELMGDIAVYADTGDMYQWLNIIRRLSSGSGEAQIEQGRRACRPNLPTWRDHINQVLSTFS